MDGTMNSGIGDYLTYSSAGRVKKVPTLSIADACSELGAVPAYIKMDIEGAELVSIRAAADFLKSHPIQFAIETHLVNKEYTDKRWKDSSVHLTMSQSSNWKGQTFTWARPVCTPCLRPDHPDALFQRRGERARRVPQVRAAVAAAGNYRYEHIFIDNASTDNTLGELKAIVPRQERKDHPEYPQLGHIRSPMHALYQPAEMPS